jgi:hypothetical protein
MLVLEHPNKKNGGNLKRIAVFYKKENKPKTMPDHRILQTMFSQNSTIVNTPAVCSREACLIKLAHKEECVASDEWMQV